MPEQCTCADFQDMGIDLNNMGTIYKEGCATVIDTRKVLEYCGEVGRMWGDINMIHDLVNRLAGGYGLGLAQGEWRHEMRHVLRKPVHWR